MSIESDSERRARNLKNPIYGTDLSKPTSACIADVRNKIAEVRGQLTDIMRGKGWEDRMVHVEGLLTCGLVALHDSMQEIYKHELECLEHDKGPSLTFKTRGIGLDQTPGCFCCDATRRNAEANLYLHNIAAITSVEDADALLAMFPRGARMDHYHGNGNFPQIKIGACDEHLDNLKALHSRTEYYGRIRQEDVDFALKWEF